MIAGKLFNLNFGLPSQRKQPLKKEFNNYVVVIKDGDYQNPKSYFTNINNLDEPYVAKPNEIVVSLTTKEKQNIKYRGIDVIRSDIFNELMKTKDFSDKIRKSISNEFKLYWKK
jgi:hypothetical protein